MRQRSVILFRGIVLAVLLVSGCGCMLAQSNTTAPASAKANVPASAQSAIAQPVLQAPVVVRGKTLFRVPGVLSFPADQRAQAISQRITDLSKDAKFQLKSLAVADGDGNTDIVAGDLVLMSVTDVDAHAAGKARDVLATQYTDIIRTDLISLRKAYSIKTLTLGALYVLLVTLVLIFLFRILGVVFRKLYALVEANRKTRIPSLRIQKFELLPADRIADTIIGLAKLLRFALALVVLYFYASLVLGFFPQTQGYAHTLLGYVVYPLQVVGNTILGYLPNLFFIAVIIFVAFYIAKFTRIFFAEIGKGTIVFTSFHREWAEPTYKIVRFLIMAITAIAVFPYLPGANSHAFQGISIFLGVLISLGSTSAVANIVAGVILTYMRAFQLGDRVQIADTVGDVIEVSLLVTRIRTIKNVEITIANSMVLNSHIINFSGSVAMEKLILHTTVTIGYDVPWRKIHELLQHAAAETVNILKSPAPFVLQTALDDFYVHYQINAYTDKPALMATTYSDLHQSIQDTFFAAGVEIMSSHYSTIRDGNRAAIPDEYLPSDYKTPSFRVGMENLGGNPGSGKKPDEQ